MTKTVTTTTYTVTSQGRSHHYTDLLLPGKPAEHGHDVHTHTQIHKSEAQTGLGSEQT